MEARDLLGLERPEGSRTVGAGAPEGQETEEMRDEPPSELASLLTMSAPRHLHLRASRQPALRTGPNRLFRAS